MSWLEQAERAEGRLLIDHVESMHYGIPGWPGPRWVVSHEHAALITHERDHENDEGMRTPHVHDGHGSIFVTKIDLSPKHAPAKVAKQTSWLQRFADLFR